MKQFLAAHIKLVIVVIVVVAAILVAWFILSSTEPALGSYTVTRGNVTMSLDEPGTIAAENKADIAFQEPGQIAHVYVTEGNVVTAGAMLADLDSASFEAGVAQAKAALAAAQAKLDALQTGATPQEIAVSQAALTSAQQSLSNSYAGIANILNDAYAKANDAVRTQLAAFFSTSENNNPQLTFSVSDTQVVNNIDSARLAASVEMNTWQGELAGTSGTPGTNALDADLQDATGHLSVIQNLMDLTLTALTDEAGLAESSVASYRASATAGLNEVNAAVTEVSDAEQAISSEKAAVAQAQAGLDLTSASSTLQDIQEQQAVVAQAQAAVSTAQVALDNTSLTAPFPGTVQDLTAQVGQVVSPGVPVLSLVNNSGLKIQAYVSEIDVAKIKVGDTASITLDAFGTGTTFPAIVTTIDSAETQVNGVPSYLVTLHFAGSVSQVKDGMTGNVHMVLAEDDNVIFVPSRLILNDGNQNFVLIKTPGGILDRQVQLGLMGDNGMTEIASGLREGDILANF
jgi:HlyD family secretion protein